MSRSCSIPCGTISRKGSSPAVCWMILPTLSLSLSLSVDFHCRLIKFYNQNNRKNIPNSKTVPFIKCDNLEITLSITFLSFSNWTFSFLELRFVIWKLFIFETFCFQLEIILKIKKLFFCRFKNRLECVCYKNVS